MGAIGLVVSVHDVVTHQTSDPEVIIAEFAYHGHVGRADKSFKLPAIFVLRVRAGEIVESRDYFGQRQSLDSKPEWSQHFICADMCRLAALIGDCHERCAAALVVIGIRAAQHDSAEYR